MLGLRQYADRSWEMLPRYGKVESLKEGIRLGMGTCAERSRLIGTMALSDGFPAMRIILLGADGYVVHYSNLLFDGRSWTGLSTNAIYKSVSVSTVSHPLDVTSTSWSAGGSVNPPLKVESNTMPQASCLMFIPEIEMTRFRYASTTADHFRVATDGLDFAGIGFGGTGEPVI